MDNLLDSILSRAEDLQSVGAAAGLILLVLVLLFRGRGREGKKAPPARRRPSAAPATTTAIAETRAAPATIMEAPSGGSIEVSEADPLAEVAVYIEFGYLDQAAQTLRSYVDSSGGANNLEVLRKLLQVYHRMGHIDDYADILERLCNAGQDQGFVREAVLAGLTIDRDNLPLRVLADSRLGLDPGKIDELLGPAETPPHEAPRAPAPAAPEVKPVAAAPAQPAPAPQKKAAAAPRPALRLVEGKSPLQPLSAEEKTVLQIFANPAHEARVHLAVRDLDNATAALRRAISAQPRNLTNFTELLGIFQARRQVDEYARTLWHLYSVLNGAGRPLRERLLGIGFALGDHPLLEALAQSKDGRHLEAIGRQFGLIPAELVSSGKFHLVEVAQHAEPALTAEAVKAGDILAEVDSYLEYGQTEQALDSLEAAVIKDPMDARLYPPLLDLYDRMDELTRFTALAAKVKKLVPRPPEEVVPMMLNLYNRLQHRRQESAA